MGGATLILWASVFSAAFLVHGKKVEDGTNKKLQVRGRVARHPGADANHIKRSHRRHESELKPWPQPSYNMTPEDLPEFPHWNNDSVTVEESVDFSARSSSRSAPHTHSAQECFPVPVPSIFVPDPCPCPVIMPPNPILPHPNPIPPNPNPIPPNPNPGISVPDPIPPDPNPMLPDPNPILPNPKPMLPNPNPILPNPNPMLPCPDPMLPCADPCQDHRRKAKHKREIINPVNEGVPAQTEIKMNKNETNTTPVKLEEAGSASVAVPADTAPPPRGLKISLRRKRQTGRNSKRNEHLKRRRRDVAQDVVKNNNTSSVPPLLNKEPSTEATSTFVAVSTTTKPASKGPSTYDPFTDNPTTGVPKLTVTTLKEKNPGTTTSNPKPKFYNDDQMGSNNFAKSLDAVIKQLDVIKVVKEPTDDSKQNENIKNYFEQIVKPFLNALNKDDDKSVLELSKRFKYFPTV